MTVTGNVRVLFAFGCGLVMTLAALFVFQAVAADATPGDADATFVPVTACRLIDTRSGDTRVGPHNTFGAGDTKTIAAHGSNGDCTIPTDATGLSMNVTAVDASVPSFLTIWPDGERPNASSLNPAPGQPPTPNGVATQLAANGSFNVYNLAGSVDVIVDINGYYTKASLQEMASQLAELEKSRSFAATEHETDSVVLTGTPNAVVSVTMSAPVTGHVTVDSNINVTHTVDGEEVWCAIYRDDTVPLGAVLPTEPSFQRWETGGLGNAGSLAGSRTFPINVGATTTYSLVCEESADGGTVFTRSLTAIFTPAP